MPASGLSATRLADAIVGRLISDVDAAEKDENGKDTNLREVVTIIAETVISEIKNAKISVSIPAGAVITTVSEAAGGKLNENPIQADNSVAGGLS